MLWSPEAEAMVLGGLLIEPELTDSVGLMGADFFNRDNRRIFEAIQVESNPDIVTVTERLRGKVSASYVGDIAANVASAANIQAHAGIVKDYANRRRLMEIFQAGLKAVQTEKASGIASETAARIESLNHGEGESHSFQDVLLSAADSITSAMNARQSGGLIGVPTGIPAIDRKTGGLCAPRLIVLAGRPGLGKTALANQIALNGASRGYPVGVCSLEMGADELGTRAISNRYQLNFSKLMVGDPDEIAQAKRCLSEKPISDLPIHTDTETCSLSGIVSRITEWRRRYGIRLAVVDYLGLVETGSDQSSYEQLGIVSRTLKQTAKRLDIAILALHQLNRSHEKENRRPRMSDLRDSGKIEQDADIAMMLHAGDSVTIGGEQEIDFGLVKNRAGRAGWFGDRERIVFDGKTQTFRQLSDDFTRSDRAA